MGTGRVSRRSNITDQLTLANLYTRFDAARERRHMAVGGLIAVIMLEADVFAVAGFPARLLHRTITGGVDRRTQRRGPIQARMHLGGAKDRIAARTGTRS